MVTMTHQASAQPPRAAPQPSFACALSLPPALWRASTGSVLLSATQDRLAWRLHVAFHENWIGLHIECLPRDAFLTPGHPVHLVLSVSVGCDAPFVQTIAIGVAMSFGNAEWYPRERVAPGTEELTIEVSGWGGLEGLVRDCLIAGYFVIVEIDRIDTRFSIRGFFLDLARCRSPIDHSCLSRPHSAATNTLSFPIPSQHSYNNPFPPRPRSRLYNSPHPARRNSFRRPTPRTLIPPRNFPARRQSIRMIR